MDKSPVIENIAYARAGLLGNPSDGFFGKTIAISIKNFCATVSMSETSELVVEEMEADRNRFRDIRHFASSIRQNGYYGGQRLIKAVIKRFIDHCREADIKIPDRNFTVRYQSSIPRQVGLAGSSAIAAATLKSLMQFYEISIPKEIQPTLILEAETRELGINAGLQDRVIQIYEGCVYMDFDKKHLDTNNYGIYRPLDPTLLPPLYLAYKTDLSKVSGPVFNNLKERFAAGDRDTLTVINEIADLADQGRSVLQNRDYFTLNLLINRNFDLRRKIMNISDSNVELVETARRSGVSAKFSGSGGAIIGSYSDDETFNRLTDNMKNIGAEVIKISVI